MKKILECNVKSEELTKVLSFNKLVYKKDLKSDDLDQNASQLYIIGMKNVKRTDEILDIQFRVVKCKK